MKKLAIVAVAAMFCAVGAFGVSITVPFFTDSAPADGSFPPSEGSAAYIGVRNITDETVLLALEYFDAVAEQDATPADNTFHLEPMEGFGFRPSVEDSAIEGSGVRAPIMTQGSIGAVTISWDGQPGDIVGRVLHMDPDGNAYSFGLGLGDARADEEENND